MSDTGDIKKGLPTWVQFVFGILIPLAGVAVGYGELTARQSALDDRVTEMRAVLEQRIDRAERDGAEDRKDVARVLDGVKNDVAAVKVDLARICVRLKCKE